MNKKEKTPVELVAELLAEMTERAMTAERERDASREEAGRWYKHYQNKVEELVNAEVALEAKEKENAELRLAIQEYIAILEKNKKE